MAIEKSVEDDDVIFVVFDFLADRYKWSWRQFWYETPVFVISKLVRLKEQKMETGYLNETEIAVTKAQIRLKDPHAFG